MISIANPIYDAVFKYLMEDERIARTILSALLKKDIVEVEARKHEYANGSRDKISMFRIDFGAKVRQDDGSLKLILIELQKTWLGTETLRFRQYLSAQYADPANISREDTGHDYGLPMITVYLLGHRVGDIEEPVLYVRHKAYDYEGKEVTKGIPDPFVDSLVHSSIIVQIPLLHGKVNNRLDEVLSVFDQRHKDKDNQQVIHIDDREYAGDEEMSRIIHRLLTAAADAKLRQDMNVEDEYFSAIEDRDTAIMQRDKIINERDKIINERDKIINERDKTINEQGAKLAEQETQLAEQETQLAEQETQLAEQETQLAEQDAKLANTERALITSARALLSAGFSVAQVAEMTHLDKEDIEKLKQLS